MGLPATRQSDYAWPQDLPCSAARLPELFALSGVRVCGERECAGDGDYKCIIAFDEAETQHNT